MAGSSITVTMSARRFIILVNEAYPKVAETPIFTTDQVMLLWRVLHALDNNPGLLRIKSVRHNLSGPKLRWLEFLESRLQEDTDGTV
jgi:hypothetical protein